MESDTKILIFTKKRLSQYPSATPSKYVRNSWD